MNKEILLSLPFIGEMSEEDKQYTLNNAVRRVVEINESTINTNTCDGLVVLESGKLRVFMTSQTGKEITLYHLSANDTCVLSYGCKIGNLPFNIQVQALQKSTVFNIPNSVLTVLQDKYPTIKHYLLDELSNRLTEVMGLVEKVAFTSLDVRLINLLLSQNSSIIYKTHADLASDLGTSREIISRLLKSLEKENLLELSRGKIKLLDIDKLVELSND